MILKRKREQGHNGHVQEDRELNIFSLVFCACSTKGAIINILSQRLRVTKAAMTNMSWTLCIVEPPVVSYLPLKSCMSATVFILVFFLF